MRIVDGAEYFVQEQSRGLPPQTHFHFLSTGSETTDARHVNRKSLTLPSGTRKKQGKQP